MVSSGWRTWKHPESKQISGGDDGIPFQLRLVEPVDESETDSLEFDESSIEISDETVMEKSEETQEEIIQSKTVTYAYIPNNTKKITFSSNLKDE